MVVREVRVPIAKEASIDSVSVRIRLVSFRPISTSAAGAITSLPMEASTPPKRW